MNSINKETCKKCKLCIEVCPCKVIGINGEIHFLPEREHICLKCGQCMAICKTQSISLDSLNYNNNFNKLPSTNISYSAFIDFISTRRSVRNFKAKSVSNEIIGQVLEAISYAPYGAAPEKTQVTVLNNREQIESSLPHIENFLNSIVKWMENPIARFMIKRKKGEETFNTIRNHLYPISKSKNYQLDFGDRITRGAPTVIVFHAEAGAEEHSHNGMINATYAMLAAHALGLGAAMNGLVPAAINKCNKVREIYDIPEGHEAIIALILGYSKFRYHRTIKHI
jgi:NAD-dependent dihydropyrimidine dehydrogenase PreA subunit/nitroreductase